MRQLLRVACGFVAAATLTTTLVASGTASAGVPQSSIVNQSTPATTPGILDTSKATEKVLDIQQAGSRIVVAGYFSRVQNSNGNGGATFNRSNVFAFDTQTGAVDTGFAPTVNGTVTSILPSADGRTVYLGGSFTIVNGQSSRNVVQLDLATGQKTAFNAPAFNGQVSDLGFAAGRLIIGGTFTTAGGLARRGLASVDPVSGTLDRYVGIQVSGNHNYPHNGTARGAVGVENFAISPDGSRMIVIGNFRTADGQPRDQVMNVLFQANSAVVDPNWRTRWYEPACYAARFDSYVRDVDYSPDGSYFVISSTGGHYGGAICDAVARWDSSSSGQAVQPAWRSYSGGDTLFTVEATGPVVYTGGHPRWMNNTLGNSVAGPGSVPRPGLAALDARTGVPLAWNPGRNPRGVGAEALLATDRGLYVGMDTEWIGNRQYKRQRLAYFPLSGGAAIPAEQTGTLPANVYLGGRDVARDGAGVNDLLTRYYTGATVGATQTLPSGLVWARMRGAFLVDGTLFYGYPSAGGTYYLYKRTFDGTNFGPQVGIDPYNDPYWSTKTTTDSAGRTVYFRGKIPNFYGTALEQVTGMFFQDGRLYYTRSGQSQLFYRYFSTDSGIVSPQEMSAGGTGFNDVMGMFVDGNTVYAGRNSNGELRKISLVNGVPSGSWALAAPGPAAGGPDWRTRSMFLGPGGPNQAPTAAFTSTCAGLVCTFDGRSSTDRDGTVATYQWDFGDGQTATGATVNHTFAAGADHSVTLTVTDDKGATSQKVQAVSVAAPGPAPESGIAVRDAAGTSARSATSVSLTVPASVQPGDALLLVLSTNSTVTGTAPAGWAEEGRQASGSSITTQVWSRVAQAGDAGAQLTVPLSGQAKATLQLAAYSGVSAADPVAMLAGKVDVGGTAHTTPTATAQAGSWVVSIWSDKQAAAHTWSAPTGVVVRDNQAGAGSGDPATLLGDSGIGLPAGTVGGLTATVPTASNRATAFTVVLTPAA
jgi:hypothetical protein